MSYSERQGKTIFSGDHRIRVRRDVEETDIELYRSQNHRIIK